MRRTSGFIPALAAGLLGWILFLGGQFAVQAGVPFARKLMGDYYASFFTLFFYLLALVPVLAITGGLGVRRKQLRLPVVLLVIAAYVLANYGLLWVFRPFFLTGYPLG